MNISHNMSYLEWASIWFGRLAWLALIGGLTLTLLVSTWLIDPSSGFDFFNEPWAARATIVTSLIRTALQSFAAFFVLEGLSWMIGDLLDLHDDLAARERQPPDLEPEGV
jgi:hypothetical protein